MTRRSLFLGALLVLLVGLGLAFWLWPRPQGAVNPASAQVTSAPPPVVTPPPAPPAEPPVPLVDIPNTPGHPLSDQDKQNISKIVRMVHAPISFWGKVIDQDKNPVPDANVLYSAADHYFGTGDKYQGSSDGSGLFSITDIQGMALFVEVSKDGYYQVAEKSMRSFPQAHLPSKDDPAIFELRKKGQAENLIYMRKDIMTGNGGNPTGVILTNGLTVNGAGGDVTLALLSNDQTVPLNSGQSYDWHFKITVPNGGVQPRTGDQFNFEAPTDGYQPSDKIEMTKGADQWHDSGQKEYFVKLADGRYARVTVFVAAQGHFVSVTSYLNPTPGHRNLEYDPEQQASR